MTSFTGRRRPRIRLPGVAGLLAVGLAGGAVQAQVVPIDEASFRLSRNGSVVGQEDVTIHRLGLGQDARIIGQSEVRLQDGSQLRPRIEATPDLRATTYQNEFTGSDGGEVVVSRIGRRLVARSRSAAGEAQREYPATERTVVLESDIVLLYYFLQPWVDSDGVQLTALDPRASTRRELTLTAVGSEEVRVGRNPVQGRHMRLEGSDTRVDFWMDDEGRVLKVVLPGSGFEAERLPR
ncbi:MAG: hypothetical protein P8188_02910 [Gemmatimonadota bacterium]|jgi:hypothetical protein